jgi:hypothetical protein
MMNPAVIQNQGDFPIWIGGENILRKSNNRYSIGSFFFSMVHLPGFIVNCSKQFGSFMFALRRHFTLSAARELIVLKCLIRANHRFVFKEQMSNFFGFYLLFKLSKGVLFEKRLGFVIGFS